MSKSYRSLLWTGAILATVAACGDDVTVIAPPGGGINSVTVAPDQATIPVQGTVQMIAAVNADSGVATTVTWNSSNPSVASISATGLVTGVAAGTVGITACSTVNSSACGAATVTVAAPVPATISIQSVTTGTTNTPVNINNVTGQIDVSLNFEPGSTPATSVELLIDGAVVASQGFSSLEWAALVSKAVEEGGELAKVVIVLSVNTAAFNATTGVPSFFNGPRQLSARANLQGGAQVATPSTTLIFANANIVVVTTSVANGSTANDANGILWSTGDLVATAVPVIYTSANPTIQQVVLDPEFLDPVVLTSAPYTATWAKGTDIGDGGAGSGNSGIEDDDLVVTANSTVNGAAGPSGVSSPFPFDTQAPEAPDFRANPNLRQNGWINATVGLTGSNTSSTDNDWLINGTTDQGVGGYNRMLRIGDGTDGTVDDAIAQDPSAAPALPAPSLNNDDYCAVATATDNLGNESDLPEEGDPCEDPPAPSFTDTNTNHLRFGVDVDKPTIAFSGGLAALGATAGRIVGANVGTEFQVTVLDAGAVGVSGMPADRPVSGTVKIFNASGTTCFIGSGSGCANVNINNAAALPLVPTTTVAGSTTDGYYTGSFMALDAAGNASDAITRSIVFEVTGNPATLTNALFNVPLNGGTATFTALSSDNLDIRDVQYSLTYAGGLTNPILYPVTAINATPPVPATLKNSNVSAGTTINGFMRQIENVTANAPVAVGGAFKPSAINGVIRDQVQASAPVVTGIAAGQVTTGVSYLAAAAAQLIHSWAVTNAATNVSDGAAANPANAESVTLNADAFGPTNTFAAPFTRVDFYVDFGGNLVQVGTGTLAPTQDDGSQFGRRQRWTFSFTPGEAFGVGALNIYAIGVNAAGDALVSPTNANITVTNP